MLLDQKRRGVGLGLTSIIKDDFGGSSFHSPIMDCSELSQEGHPLGSKPNGLVPISSRRFDPALAALVRTLPEVFSWDSFLDLAAAFTKRCL